MCLYIYSFLGIVFYLKIKINLMNLLGWHWLIKLYRFQVYSSKYIICILYRVFTAPSQVSFISISPPFTLFYLSSLHLPLVITMLLPVSVKFFFSLCLIPSPFSPSPLAPSLLRRPLFCAFHGIWYHLMYCASYLCLLFVLQLKCSMTSGSYLLTAESQHREQCLIQMFNK